MSNNISLEFPKFDFESPQGFKSHTDQCQVLQEINNSTVYDKTVDVDVSNIHPTIFKCRGCQTGIDICSPSRKAIYLLNGRTCSKKCKLPHPNPVGRNEIKKCLSDLDDDISFQNGTDLVENENCDCLQACHCTPVANSNNMAGIIYLFQLQKKLMMLLI